MHLLLPLAASLLFVGGLILVKRAGAAGLGSVTSLFLTNMFVVVVFSVLWLFGGTLQPWTMLWQPLTIAALFMLGLMFTFLAIDRGDVSIATPIFGLKVVIVAFLLSVFGIESLPATVWYAAVLATLGIALIQWTGQDHPKRIMFTIVLALSAAFTYASFDVLVQRWSPAWGAGRFLPLVFWMVGLLSLGMLPWVDWTALRRPAVLRSIVPGALLLSAQAICIVLAVSVFGDAARVNVVYALRGLWGVGLAWIVAVIWGGPEAHLSRSVMTRRMTGAALLTVAVVFVILSR